MASAINKGADEVLNFGGSVSQKRITSVKIYIRPASLMHGSTKHQYCFWLLHVIFVWWGDSILPRAWINSLAVVKLLIVFPIDDEPQSSKMSWLREVHKVQQTRGRMLPMIPDSGRHTFLRNRTRASLTSWRVAMWIYLVWFSVQIYSGRFYSVLVLSGQKIFGPN